MFPCVERKKNELVDFHKEIAGFFEDRTNPRQKEICGELCSKLTRRINHAERHPTPQQSLSLWVLSHDIATANTLADFARNPFSNNNAVHTISFPSQTAVCDNEM